MPNARPGLLSRACGAVSILFLTTPFAPVPTPVRPARVPGPEACTTADYQNVVYQRGTPY